MQPNGLPAWRIDVEGTIADTQSASDADVLMAWVLLRDEGPNRVEHNAAGLQLANAVLQHEVIFTDTGNAVLAAGPWAVEKASINVSYWSSAIFDDLARLTGNSTWAVMADQVPAMLDELTRNGMLLPPDWAQLNSDVLQPIASPRGVGSSPSVEPQYGLDAQRAILWLGASCRPEERHDAARWNAMLN
jgi:endo-1,4-beta-D-glucanase Y